MAKRFECLNGAVEHISPGHEITRCSTEADALLTPTRFNVTRRARARVTARAQRGVKRGM